MMKCETVILQRLFIGRLLIDRFSPDTGKTVYFWDMHGKSEGIFIFTCFRILGRHRTALMFQQLADMIGLDLRMIMHADHVDDYHQLQLMVENDTKRYIDNYFKKSEYSRDKIYQSIEIDDDCIDSMTLKNTGYRLETLLENIRVIRRLFPAEIKVYVAKNNIPKGLVELVEAGERVRVYEVWPPGILLNYILFILYSIYGIMKLGGRCLFSRTRSIELSRQPRIIAEFVDPDCAAGKATEPNYMVKHGVPARDLFAYVRTAQRKNISNSEFTLGDEIAVIDCQSLPINARILTTVIVYYLNLYREIYLKNLDLYTIRKLSRELDLVIDLLAMFRLYTPAIHVYNTIPNGRAGTRYDSGIITGICRKYGAQSITYQTRVMYRHNIYYHFDVFDHYYMWGKAWIDEYGSSQFVKHFGITGNTGLDNYRKNTQHESVSGAMDQIIAVFTSDIDDEYPLHYTWEYTRIFMSDVLTAVGLHNLEQGGKKCRIVLKPKDPGHIPRLMSDTILQSVINKYNIRIEIRAQKRHDVESVLEAADKIISIGFTTPGFDALGLGKPSVYYTPYKNIYNRIFDHETNLVAHSVNELMAFLGDESEISAAEMSELFLVSEKNPGRRLVREVMGI